MKIKIKRIKNLFKKIPKTLARHPFLTFWGLLIIALVLGGFIFYKYSILAEKPETEPPKELLKFGQNTYQEVLNQWQQREEELRNVDSKQYTNPFQETRGEVSSATSSEKATSTEEGLPPEESPEEELPPEETIPSSEIEKLLAATSLSEFYRIKGERLPFVSVRAKMWQEKGLGPEEEYKGTKYQNLLFLEKLKEELIPE